MGEREQGILDASGEYPEMEVVASQAANCQRAEAMQVMENLLQRKSIQRNLIYGWLKVLILKYEVYQLLMM